MRPLSNSTVQRRITDLAAQTSTIATPVQTPTPSDPPPDGRVALSDDQAQALIEAYQAGTSLKELRSQFGISQRSIFRYVERAGISRRPRRRMSPDDVAEAAELYKAGTSLKELGEKYGVNDETVRVRLREVGVITGRRGGVRHQ